MEYTAAQESPDTDGYLYNGEPDRQLPPEVARAAGSAEALPLKSPFAKRPVIIDLADGPCEMCALNETRNQAASKEAGRPVSTCFRCGEKDFTQGVHSDATKWMHSNGFRSVKPSHYHLWHGESGGNGKEAYWDELCLTCYREDYQSVYPDLEPPV